MSIIDGRVIRASLVGWAGMTGVMTLTQLLRIPGTDIIGIEGAYLAKPKSRQAYLIGSAIHLGMCLWIALVYRLGFRVTGLRPGRRTGASGGLIHWLIAGLVAHVVTQTHLRRGQLDMPGFAGTRLGPVSAVGFFVIHLIFGMLVGWQYKQEHH